MVKYMVDIAKDDGTHIIRRLTLDDQVKEPVYHGDHLTFGMITRKDDSLVIKTHWTSYSNIAMDPYLFERDTIDCNFTFHPDIVKQIKCENKRGYDERLLQQVYDPSIVAVIQKLCLTASARDQKGGTAEQSRVKGHNHPGDFFRDEFSVFLSVEIFNKLVGKGDLETIQVMYAKNTIIVMTDYMHPTRYVYILNAAKTFKAFKAWFRIVNGRNAGPV